MYIPEHEQETIRKAARVVGGYFRHANRDGLYGRDRKRMKKLRDELEILLEWMETQDCDCDFLCEDGQHYPCCSKGYPETIKQPEHLSP